MQIGQAVERVRAAVRRRLFASPVIARHSEYSMLYSEDDAPSRPSERLLDLAFAAASAARGIDLSSVATRMQGRFTYPDEVINTWPGTHYRLLAGLVRVLQPHLVIEIGTAEGLSALSMLMCLPPEGRIVTFDIVPWPEYPRPCLRAADFVDGRLSQVLADLGDPRVFDAHRPLLEQADLIFVDAPKDGVFEPKLVALLDTLIPTGRPIVVFDDVRMWTMLALWRQLRWPKLDLTSFGHWCGTGLCELGTGRPADARDQTLEAAVEHR